MSHSSTMLVPSNIKNDMNTILHECILPRLSINDYALAFKENNSLNVTSILEFYYSWIEEHIFRSDIISILENIFLFLEQDQGCIDVSIVQKFSCLLVKERKLHRLKERKEEENNQDDDEL